jgi:hypothetical protein
LPCPLKSRNSIWLFSFQFLPSILNAVEKIPALGFLLCESTITISLWTLSLS